MVSDPKEFPTAGSNPKTLVMMVKNVGDAAGTWLTVEGLGWRFEG
jgi:archaellum component FlaG (FlaF/FlaG flagellin family)